MTFDISISLAILNLNPLWLLSFVIGWGKIEIKSSSQHSI